MTLAILFALALAAEDAAPKRETKLTRAEQYALLDLSRRQDELTQQWKTLDAKILEIRTEACARINLKPEACEIKGGVVGAKEKKE